MLLHLLIVLLVVVMVNLGFWQLRRLHERRTSNDEVRARTTAPAAPIDSVATRTISGDALSALRYRNVTAQGTYDTAKSSVVLSRVQDGGPGGWVVTPLRLDPAHLTGDSPTTVLVLRGFVRLNPDGSAPDPAPPTGAVDVSGYTLAISGFDNIARHDLSALNATAGGPPVVVQAKATTPADDASLEAIPLPTLDDGPHLSYAVQWFLFSTIAAVGYPFALRRAASKREADPE